MDAKKTIKNIAVIFICLLGIALIGINIHQHQQIKKARQLRSSETYPDNETTTETLPYSEPAYPTNASQNPAPYPDEVQTVDNEAEELIYHLDAAEEELDIVQEQLADEEAKKAEQKRLQRELQKKYREDPSYEKSMRDSLDIQYADLFEKLNLPPEELEEFKDLLFEEIMAKQDIYNEYDTDGYATLSKEQREELTQRYMELNEEYESKYADLLGEDNYEIYQAYTETQNERYNVNNFIETLGSDEKLTETKKEALIISMNEEIKNVTWESLDLNEESEASSNMYSEKNIERMMAIYNLQIEAYSKAADSILSGSQLEKFKTYLQKKRDQYKLYMEMAALRYGTSSTQEGGDKDSE